MVWAFGVQQTPPLTLSKDVEVSSTFSWKRTSLLLLKWRLNLSEMQTTGYYVDGTTPRGAIIESVKLTRTNFKPLVNGLFFTYLTWKYIKGEVQTLIECTTVVTLTQTNRLASPVENAN